MRDSERQRVYDAEAGAFTGTLYEQSLGMFELRSFAEALSSRALWRRRGGGSIDVREARVDAGRSCARPGKCEIRIAAGQDSVATLAHEAAHLISHDGHGPAWRRTQLGLLGVLAGAEAPQRLEASYVARGLLIEGESWEIPERGLCDLALAELFKAGKGELERDRAARRVSRLLAKAQSTTEAEANALRTKAFELARKAGVDAAMAPENKGEVIVEREIFLGSGPYVGLRGMLLGALAHSYSCQVIWITTSEGRVVYVTGYESDVYLVRTLFMELDVASRLALREVEVVGNALVFRRSWLGGYVAGIKESLKKAVPTEAPGSGTSLVLVERAGAVDAWVSQRWGRVRRTRRPQISSLGAYEAGLESGRVRGRRDKSLGSTPLSLASG